MTIQEEITKILKNRKHYMTVAAILKQTKRSKTHVREALKALYDLDQLDLIQVVADNSRVNSAYQWIGD
jgi:hypothetical protein